MSQNLAELGDGITVATAVTSWGDFSSDKCHIDVAHTRAKSHLILIGSAPTLQDCPLWDRILPACDMCPLELFSARTS